MKVVYVVHGFGDVVVCDNEATAKLYQKQFATKCEIARRLVMEPSDLIALAEIRECQKDILAAVKNTKDETAS